MNDAKFSVCIATYGRVNPLIHTLRSLYEKLQPSEVIISIDGCKETTNALPQLRAEFPDLKVLSSACTRGPGMAKDTAIRYASNDKILVVDDDIEFLDVSGVSLVLDALDEYALVQNLILDARGENVRSNEYPAIWLKNKKKFEISYFIGAIHWLDRRSYIAVDGYRDFEGYGFEELALSINLIRNGMKMLFWDCITIRHFQSPLGRTSERERSRTLTTNRLIIADKYFPLPLSLIQVAWWSGRHWFRYKEWLRSPPDIHRERLRIREMVMYPRLLARAFR